MKTITQISKKALESFKHKNYVFTPDEYQEAFCKEAKKHHIILDDCNKVANYIKKLDNSYQKLITNYRVKTIDDLLLFLISNLNREQIEKTKEFTNELFSYTKRVLQVVDVFPSKAKYIASKHLDFLKLSLKIDDLKKLRNEWLEFLTTYDDKNFKLYKRRCNLNGDDILEMLPQLEKCLSKEEELIQLVDSIIFSLTPSFAPFMDDEVAILNEQLKKDPSFLTSQNMADEIKTLTKKRIRKDKYEVRKKFKDIDSITESLSRKVLSLLKNSNDSGEKIKELSKELAQIDTNDEFEVVKKKLTTMIEGLDTEIKKFSDELEKENSEVEMLREKVKLLESELEEAKKEAKTDGLTNMLNKKALNEELEKQETLYKKEQKNYSVIFFDIDHFKNVNDTYGHEAGDVILKSVAMVLNRYARDVDIVARFGGEEFIIIMPETSKDKAYQFADKVRKIVENTKFIYKKTRIKITISGGVAEREETNSMDEVINLADERLYKAKKSGRNRIESE